MIALQILASGILLGGIYALISVGLNLIFGVIKVVNMAHGDFLMLGMYAAYFLFTGLAVNPYVSSIIIFPVFMVIGYIVFRLVVKPLLGKAETETNTILATLELVDRIRRERSMAVILVTHNLGIVAQLADHVAVMYAGTIVEAAPAAELLSHPMHPYTRALLRAVPHLGGRSGKLETIPGHVPPPEQFPAGCRFSDRCARRRELSPAEAARCAELRPPERECGPGHRCCCFAPLGETLREER